MCHSHSYLSLLEGNEHGGIGGVQNVALLHQMKVWTAALGSPKPFLGTLQ